VYVVSGLYKNSLLKEIFGLKEGKIAGIWRILYNYKCYFLYSLLNKGGICVVSNTQGKDEICMHNFG
jgi:hypothetical protein